MPASHHHNKEVEYEDEEDDDEEEDAPSHSLLDSETGLNGESRGRNQEPVVA